MRFWSNLWAWSIRIRRLWDAIWSFCGGSLRGNEDMGGSSVKGRVARANRRAAHRASLAKVVTDFSRQTARAFERGSLRRVKWGLTARITRLRLPSRVAANANGWECPHIRCSPKRSRPPQGVAFTLFSRQSCRARLHFPTPETTIAPSALFFKRRVFSLRRSRH